MSVLDDTTALLSGLSKSLFLLTVISYVPGSVIG